MFIIYCPSKVLVPTCCGGGAEPAEPTKDGDGFLKVEGEPLGDMVGGVGVSAGPIIDIIMSGSIMDEEESPPPPNRDFIGLAIRFPFYRFTVCSAFPCLTNCYRFRTLASKPIVPIRLMVILVTSFTDSADLTTLQNQLCLNIRRDT